MGPALAALLVCAVSVRSQSGPDLPHTVRQPDTGPQTAKPAVLDEPLQTAGDSGADLTKLLTRLVDGQLTTQKALSDLSLYVREGFAMLQQEMRRAQMLGRRCSDHSVHPVSTHQEKLQRTQALGQRCRSDSDCSDLRADTVCSSGGRCTCGEGLQEMAGGACRPYPRLSEPCRRDSDCRGAIDRSTCSDNVCVCWEGYVNDKGTDCRYPRLSEACTDPRMCQALTQHSTCKDNQCVCEEHYWNDRDTVCRLHPNIHDVCNTTGECQVRSENSTCKDGICACVDGYLPRWDSYLGEVVTYDGCAKVVSPGSNCSNHAECGTTSDMMISRTAATFCLYGKCVCRFATLHIGERYIDARLYGGGDCEGGYLRDLATGMLICDADWTAADADVLCRTLGFSGGRPHRSGEAPPLDDYSCIGYRVTCSGTEKDANYCEWSPNDGRDVLTPVSVKCHWEDKEIRSEG